MYWLSETVQNILLFNKERHNSVFSFYLFLEELHFFFDMVFIYPVKFKFSI